MPQIIYLIGYMACGKTTLGRALSARGDADFVDLDQEIEARSGLSPAQWFAQRGEAAFRAAERETLRGLRPATGSERPLIVATGGGTASNAGAMDFMLANGLTVWLEASLDRTIARLLDADGQRPLVAGKSETELREFIPAHLQGRLADYGRASKRFDTSHLDTAEEIAATVEKFKQLLGECPHPKRQTDQ